MMDEEGEKGEKGGAAESFVDLHIYQRARDLTNRIYQASRLGEFAKDRSLVDQIRRATVSIMSNIAEGFERGEKTVFIQFLYIAKGSCGEVRDQMQIALDQGYISVSDHDQFRALAKQTTGSGRSISFRTRLPKALSLSKSILMNRIQVRTKGQ